MPARARGRNCHTLLDGARAPAPEEDIPLLPIGSASTTTCSACARVSTCQGEGWKRLGPAACATLARAVWAAVEVCGARSAPDACGEAATQVCGRRAQARATACHDASLRRRERPRPCANWSVRAKRGAVDAAIRAGRDRQAPAAASEITSCASPHGACATPTWVCLLAKTLQADGPDQIHAAGPTALEAAHQRDGRGLRRLQILVAGGQSSRAIRRAKSRPSGPRTISSASARTSGIGAHAPAPRGPNGDGPFVGGSSAMKLASASAGVGGYVLGRRAWTVTWRQRIRASSGAGGPTCRRANWPPLPNDPSARRHAPGGWPNAVSVAMGKGGGTGHGRDLLLDWPSVSRLPATGRQVTKP